LARTISVGGGVIPGEYLLDEAAGAIEANAGRRTARVLVQNKGDRPVQVGSHFHFFEVNRELLFDRAAAYGMRLNIPAGTAVRFEPGEEKEVELTNLGGARVVRGFGGVVNGARRYDHAQEGARQAECVATPFDFAWEGSRRGEENQTDEDSEANLR
jgi:urease subunit beta